MTLPHNGTPESKAAARDAAPRAQAQRERIMDLVRRAEPHGMTCDEFEALTGALHQTASARFSELQHKYKLLVKVLPLRKTRTGSEAGPYSLAPRKPEQVGLAL